VSGFSPSRQLLAIRFRILGKGSQLSCDSTIVSTMKPGMSLQAKIILRERTLERK
jgi:hypothetical protein